MDQKVSRQPIVTRIGKTLLATHLLPSIVVTTMTTALAYGSGQQASLWLLIPAVLLGQFCIGWTNDYLDRHRDRAAGRSNKPIVSGAVQAQTIRCLAIVAFITSLLFSLAYSTIATVVYVIALSSALLYNFRLKNSVLSPITYIVSFGLLPVYVALGSAQPFIPNAWIIVALALWGVGVHVQNVIPDFEHDAKTGVKGAAHYMNTYSATLLTGAALTLSVGSLCLLYIQQAPTYIWTVVAIFFISAAVFAGLLLTKRLSLAYRASMAMTAIVSLLIICSGPYLK